VDSVGPVNRVSRGNPDSSEGRGTLEDTFGYAQACRVDILNVIRKGSSNAACGHQSAVQWRRFLLNGGGSGAGPPAGSRGRAPGQGAEGHSPPEAEKKLNFDNTKPL